MSFWDLMQCSFVQDWPTLVQSKMMAALISMPAARILSQRACEMPERQASIVHRRLSCECAGWKAFLFKIGHNLYKAR